MKKTDKQEIKAAIVVVLTFAAIAFLKVFLMLHSEKTNSLLCILLDMNTGTVFSIVAFWTVILFWSVTHSPKTMFSDIRKALHDGTVRILLLGGAALLLIPQLFWNTARFGAIEINGKKPLKAQYNWYLLCDACSGKTETLTLDADAFRLEPHSWKSGGDRFGRSRSRTAAYACYKENSVYLYQSALSSYIAACQKYQKQLEIVYYKNSGIIQTINGILLYDERTFLDSADTMILEEKRKQEEQEAAEKAIEEEEKAKSLALFSAFFESEGKNYEEIVKQLEKDGIENTYKTVYISTHYYETGEIAMFDNPHKTVYVVRDQETEDMLIVPPIPGGSTLTEITQILDDAGIPWEYHCMGSISEKDKNRDHSKDTLNTYSRSPGTPVPKGYVFWFSVRHAGEE